VGTSLTYWVRSASANPFSTSKAEKDGVATVKRKRSLGIKFVSKSLGAIVPKVIDLTDSGSDDDAIKKKVARFDEDAKNECLYVLFKYLKSNSTKIGGTVTPKRKKRNIYVDDEA